MAATSCWICGDPAHTREHRSKVSDLRSLFGDPTQADPLYFHSAKRRNFKVGSLKANLLKFTHRICNRCNSARTQVYDRAWELFSATLRSRQPPITPSVAFRCNWIFPYDTRRGMRNVHLYFAKAFGCQIVEGRIPIDIAPLSKAILDGRPHPRLYLAFGPTLERPVETMAGGSDVHLAMLGDQCAFASWFYAVGNLSVNVMYAVEGEQRQGLTHAWHPRFGHKRLVMVDFGASA